MFDIEEFARIAPEWASRLHYHPELGSTNDEALRLCESGVGNLTVVLADHQSAGRGRRGSAWTSDPGGGLLFSLILKPEYEPKYWSRLALATGLGIATVLRDQWNLPAEVKWPNDVMIEGKKCCGILVETRGSRAVLGVGINVAASPQSDESVALAELVHRPGSREQLLAALLTELADQAAASGYQFHQQVEQLRKVCYLTGKEISFTAHGKDYGGSCEGIGDDGQLLVNIGGEPMSFLQAEQVRVK